MSLTSSQRFLAFNLQMLEHMKANDLWELMNDPGFRMNALHGLKQFCRVQGKQPSPHRPCRGFCLVAGGYASHPS